MVTSRHSLFAPLCWLEDQEARYTGGWLQLMHAWALCDRQKIHLDGDSDWGPGILNSEGIVACCDRPVDVCLVRTSPFSSPCIHFQEPSSYSGNLSHLNLHLNYEGLATSYFGYIHNEKIDRKDSFRPWEHAFEEAGDALIKFVSKGHRSGVIPRYPTYLIVGILFTFITEHLVENRLFHYLVAATAGVGAFLVLAIVIVVSFFSRLAKAAQPSGPLSQAFMSLFSFLVPFGVYVNRGWVAKFFSAMYEFWESGLILGQETVPWAGKAYFGAGALLGIMLERMYLFFLEPEWLYREKGRSLVRCGQVYLDRVLSAVGLVCFLHSSSSPEVSCLTAFLSMRGVRASITHFLWTLYLSENQSPYYANGGRLQSKEEYERVTMDTTQRELAKLQKILNNEHRMGQRTGNNNLGRMNFDHAVRTRLDAFRMGGRHYENTLHDDIDIDRDIRRARGRRITQNFISFSIAAALLSAIVYQLNGGAAQQYD